MARNRTLLTTVLALLLVVAAGCGSSDSGAKDDSTPTTTAAPADGGGTTTTAADGGGGSSGGAGTIEAAVSSGATISGSPSECTVDGTNATVVADDGKFKLTITDGAATLDWTFDGGKLDEEPVANVSGKSFNLSGATPDGVGYNAEITCP